MEVIVGHYFYHVFTRRRTRFRARKTPRRVRTRNPLRRSRLRQTTSAATGVELPSLNITDYGLFERFDLNASVSTVAATMQRKLSLLIHPVIESTGMAFFDLQRRSGAKYGTSSEQERCEVQSKA